MQPYSKTVDALSYYKVCLLGIILSENSTGKTFRDHRKYYIFRWYFMLNHFLFEVIININSFYLLIFKMLGDTSWDNFTCGHICLNFIHCTCAKGKSWDDFSCNQWCKHTRFIYLLGGSGRNRASLPPLLTARQVEPKEVRAAARSGQIKLFPLKT